MSPDYTSSRSILLLLILFCIPKFFLFSQDSSYVSLFEISIEELINQDVTIATKSNQKIDKTPSVVSVITAEDIQNFGFRDIHEALSIVPGFENSQIFAGSKVLGMRGITNIKQGARFLVLINGIPTNGVLYGTGLYFGYELNMDNIERIEIIRGPGSALYGRNAFSSVVNIITKQASSDNSFNIGATFGSFNHAEVYSDYSINKNKLNSRLAIKYLTTDGTNSKFNNGMGGKSLWNLTHDNLYLNGNIQYKDFKLNVAYSVRKDGTSSPLNFLTESSTTFKIFRYDLSYSKQLSSKTQISFNTYGRQENRVQDIETLKPGVTDTVFIPQLNRYLRYMDIYPGGLYAYPVFDDYTYGTEFELRFKLLRNNNLMIGIQADIHGVSNASAPTNYFPTSPPTPNFYYDTDSNLVPYTKGNLIVVSDWIRDGGHQYKNSAIYIQDIHYLTDKIGITLGARFDLDSETGSIFNPRLGLVWEMFPFLNFKALYGEAYRAPTTSEQYKVFGYDRGNNNLTYEEIRSSEAVLGIKTDNFSSRISFYYNKLFNIIQPRLDTSLVLSYFNTGKNTSYGIEIENNIILNKSLHLFLNYDYKSSQDENEGNKTNHPNISAHTGVLGINAKISPKIRYSGYLLYIGPTEKYPNQLIDDQFISQDKIGDFFLLNSSVQLLNFIEDFDIGFYGYNLLNTIYYYQDDQNAHHPSQPEINFLVKINYHFN